MNEYKPLEFNIPKIISPIFHSPLNITEFELSVMKLKLLQLCTKDKDGWGSYYKNFVEIPDEEC